MIYCIIENGVVKNRSQADAPMAANWVQNDTAQIGWLYDGNTFSEPPPELPKLEDYDAALTAHLDSVAKSRNWQDRISLMSRAGFPGPWQADAIAFGQWADGCNVIGYQMLADFQNGLIPQPTVEEVIAALPPMVWPT